MRKTLCLCAVVIGMLVIDAHARQTPGAPRDLRAVVTGNLVTLQWSVPLTGAPPTAYLVEAGSAPGLRDLARLAIGAGVTALTAAAPNGRYFVRVIGMNADGEGPPSNEIEVIVGGCRAPDAPAALAGSVAGLAITLTWTAPVTDAAVTSFVIEAGSAPGLSNLASLDTGSSATVFRATAPAGTYYVRVRARNGCGVSAPSNEVRLVAGVAQAWSVRLNGTQLEIGYGSGLDYPQYAVLHTESGYFRMQPGGSATWGTSIIVLPSFWAGGALYQSAPVAASWRNEGETLVIAFTATMATTLGVRGEITLSPPAGDSLSAAIRVMVEGDIVLDPHPGETFKPAVLSSMHVSPAMWDAQSAFVGSQRLEMPVEGWIVTPPVVGRRFGLIGGSSAWQRGLVAPSIEVVLDEDREVTGWVTRSDDPNDDNLGLWAASGELIRSWQYTVTVTR